MLDTTFSAVFSRTTALLMVGLLALVGTVGDIPRTWGAEDSSAAVAEKESADKETAGKETADNDDAEDEKDAVAEKKESAEADKKSEKGDSSTASNADKKSAKEDDDKNNDDDESAKESDEDDQKSRVSAKSDSNADSRSSASSKSKSPAARKREKVRLALLTIKEELSESAGQVGLFGETITDLRETVSRLDRAAKDKSIAGVVLDIRNPTIGRAKIDELRAAISRFRASGKKIYAQIESGMPADYLVACACDEIVMPEAGILVLPGIHAEAMFYKDLLGKLGIQADFIHIGAYKGAAEPMTRDRYSDEVRENLTTLIDGLYDEMVSTIVKDRPLSIAEAKAAIDTGLLTAAKAKQLGLIDRIAYSDTLRDELAETYDAEPLVYVKNYGKKEVDTDFSGPMGFIKLMQVMMGGNPSSRVARGKKIAVVYAVGPIMTGKSESDPFGSSTMGSSTIVEALRKANEDKQVVGIVLRIDSPGGSALASDLIWHETQVIDKPIVASMSDVAASGGYYIAMGADKIVAAPGTITGSIGVVGGKLAVRGLLDKVGITTETIQRGRNSGMFSGSGKFSESERVVVKAMMEDIYAQFTRKAAEGRDMPLEKLRELAGGRVYTGRQALDNGLVDKLGTLHDAVDEVKVLAGLDKDDEVKIEVLPEPTNFLESLLGDLDAEEESSAGMAAGGLGQLGRLSPELVEIACETWRLRAVFDQPAAFVLPFQLEVR